MSGGQTFQLISRRRLIGLTHGTMRSVRRGRGTEVAGSRPYRPGDDIRSIDWAASARLSSARGADEFVVRERYADEGPRVVLVADRSPELSFFSPPLPWLDKAEAMQRVTEIVVASTAEAGGFVGYLDYADGEAFWLPPRGERRLAYLREDRAREAGWGAPVDGVERSLEHLFEHRRNVTAGSFVFVLSDFLDPPSRETWLTAVEHLWDIVPVVIQDPVWEQSFPDVSGIVVPIRNPRSGRITHVRLTKREAAEHRRANEERLLMLLDELTLLDLDPVLISSSEPSDVLGAFLDWNEFRRARRGVVA
ncbi:MAG TPA: DUF58 domain-containing protein [Gaiellaceae bacterium]|nr:DUF58 domain-containing protein [Gaiellaceae bacterium]